MVLSGRVFLPVTVWEMLWEIDLVMLERGWRFTLAFSWWTEEVMLDVREEKKALPDGRELTLSLSPPPSLSLLVLVAAVVVVASPGCCGLLVTEAAALRAEFTNDPAIPPMTPHLDDEPLPLLLLGASAAVGVGVGFVVGAEDSAAAMLSDAPPGGGGKLAIVGPGDCDDDDDEDEGPPNKSGAASVIMVD